MPSRRGMRKFLTCLHTLEHYVSVNFKSSRRLQFSKSTPKSDFPFHSVRGYVYRHFKEPTMLHAESLSQPLIRTNIFLAKSQRDALKSLAAAQEISAAEL